MASILGIDCGDIYGNTGRADCDIKIGRFEGLMAIKRNGSISPSATLTADNLYGLLEAAATANDPSLRIFPINKFVITADNSQDRTQQTAAGTGDTTTIRDAKKGWTWTLWNSFCQWMSFQRFNGQEGNFDFYAYTDLNQFIAINRKGVAGGLRFSDFYVSPYNEKSDDADANGTISVVIQNTRDWRNNLIVITPSEGELSELEGLRDAQPTDLNPYPLTLDGTIKIGVTTGCGGGRGGTNLIELYEDALSDTDNWTVSNAKTKAAITLTSITVSTDKSYLTFVMPTTTPYVTGDNVKFQLAGVSDLTTAEMPGYEGQSVIVKN